MLYVPAARPVKLAVPLPASMVFISLVPSGFISCTPMGCASAPETVTLTTPLPVAAAATNCPAGSAVPTAMPLSVTAFTPSTCGA